MFSLLRIFEDNPGFARHYHWARNSPLDDREEWLNLGCGARIFPGFANLDLVPQDTRITRWNLLDVWPDELVQRAQGVFAEDCLEHFFHAEQMYILCNVNRALRTGGVARLLMPSLAKLTAQYPMYQPGPHDYLTVNFGVQTPADAVNYAMRFTGHRWLPDSVSLAYMASTCGFLATETDCAHSREAKFNGLNSRDESNGSLSFAHDLTKTTHITRISVSPESVQGAARVEDLPADSALFVSTEASPTVWYVLPDVLSSKEIICINFRSANFSTFDWGMKKLMIGDANLDRPWIFDESLKSQPCMNVITQAQVQLLVGKEAGVSRLAFSPAHAAGEYFSLGHAEVFVT